MRIQKETMGDIVNHILFSSNRSFEAFEKLMQSKGLEFRKNKSMVDINNAVAKAKNPRNGYCKTEMEIEMLGCYLQDILKVGKIDK